jgi:hypothetical protein
MIKVNLCSLLLVSTFLGILLPSCSKSVDYTPKVAVTDTVAKTVNLNLISKLLVSPEMSSIVCTGSNRTLGTDSFFSYPHQLRALLDSDNVTNVSVYNAGVDWAMVDYLTSLVSTQLTPNFLSKGQNVAIVWEIDEDLYENRTDISTYYQRYITYCKALQAGGWQVISVTTPYRNVSYLSGGDYSQSGFDTLEYDSVASNIDEYIRQFWPQFSSGLADLAADGRLNHYDSIYFQADHWNLTAEGNRAVAQDVLLTMQNN